MSETTLLEDAEAHVSHLLTEQLTPDHCYHNLAHTLAVRDACRHLADWHQLPDEEREILELAALFHDSGFTLAYDQNEPKGAALAAGFLTQRQYPAHKIAQVEACILATVPDAEPTNRLQEIIKDADLSNLARTDYLQLLDNLRHEWRVFRHVTYPDAEWYRLNQQFVKNHRYYTVGARERFDDARKQNQRFLKEMARAEEKKQEKKASPANRIVGSRGAQMMFKTALRNHIDLSNLADNKANIMLSVNALIITIAMPLGFSKVTTQPYLLYPLLVLLITCLASMIFATLATRPIKMSGRTNQEDIVAGKSNLFFFGNFYAMKLTEFEKGMDIILDQDENLENAIKRDLYFLGRSLGRKYRQLRICYNIFMVGVVLAVVVFGVVFLV